MNVYIQFDFEGIAGFVIRDNQDRNIPTVFDRIKRFMLVATQEASAAVQGAFDAGADNVIVWDSHRDGDTLLIEHLPENTQLITGEYAKGPWLPFFDNTNIGIYIGGHAMAGTPRAVTPHTLIELNGRSFGEVGMFINECGTRNIPVVMVSGDAATQREVAWQIPNSEFVVTKDALGPTLAKTITPARSCKLIYEAVRRGIGRAKEITPFTVDPPYRFKTPSGDIYHTDTSDLIDAYRSFLTNHYNYNQGWPDYALRDE